jgi:hypothetical protein
MGKRIWAVGVLLTGLFIASQPAPARADVWPFSLFSSKKQPVKKPKPKMKKSAKPASGARTKAVKPVH